MMDQCYKLYFKSTIGQRCLVTSRFRVQLRLKVAPLVWPIFTRHGNFQKFIEARVKIGNKECTNDNIFHLTLNIYLFHKKKIK